VAVTPAPARTPKPRITTRPYIVSTGPMELDVKPPAGPRVRRPPLLPTPKPVEPNPETAPAPVTPPEVPAPKPPEPSAFSPDAPPTLLPSDKPVPATPEPVKKDDKKDGVLEPVEHREPELKDAVMYFDTPAGPRGSRVTIPMAVPLTTPPTAPQPESRATYRKEKE
jgi:hypothetical protein